MHRGYRDIRALTSEPPKWFDEYAVPRYCDFTPDECANIYADQCVLLLIACQNCNHRFRVCMTSDVLGRHMEHACDLFAAIDCGAIHYGDPPNVNCCPAGPTMNCEDLVVLEAYGKGGSCKWVRKPEYERDLDATSPNPQEQPHDP